MKLIRERFTTHNTAYFINSAISVALMIAFRYIPAAPPLTQFGVSVIGILLGMLYGWLFVDMIWPSILGLVMLGLTDYCTVPDAFQKAMGNNIVLLVFFFFMVAGIMNQAGVTTYIAKTMVNAKFVRGKPYLLMLMLCLAMCVLNILVSATAACLVMFPIIKEVALMYGYKKRDKWPALMIVGTTYIGGVAYALLPFKSLPAVVFGTYEALSGSALDFGKYVLCILVVLAASIVVFLLYCRFVEKIDVDNIRNAKLVEFEKLEKMTPYQRAILIYFCIVLVLLLAPSVLPKTIWIVSLLNRIGSTAIVAISVAVYGFLGFREGVPMQELFAKSITWSVFFLLGSALTIAGALLSPETGVQDWIVQSVTPLVAGKSPYIFILLILLLCVVTTNLANNVSTAAIFAPVVYTLGLAVGTINIQTLMIGVILTTSIGLATPPAGAPSAIIFADTDWFTTKLATKYGLSCVIINFLVTFAVAYHVGLLIF